MLLSALLQLVVCQEPANETLIERLLTASTNATAPSDSVESVESRILRRGPTMIGAIVHDRQRWSTHQNRARITTVLFKLKAEMAGEHGKTLLRAVETKTIDIDLANAPLDGAIDSVRRATDVNVVADPAVIAKRLLVTLKAKGTLREVMESMLAAHELEYDFRYGVVFVSSPDRLWAVPTKPLSEAEVADARRWLSKLCEDGVEQREHAVVKLKEVGLRAVPILEEGLRSKDASIVGTCRHILNEIGSAKRVHGSLANMTQWEEQLSGRAAPGRLSQSIGVNLERIDLRCVVETFLADYGDIRIAEGTNAECDLHVMDLELKHILSLLTLPRGLDIVADQGGLLIVKRK